MTLLLVIQAVVFAKGTGYDFDGDNRADLAVFRPSDGVWHILNSQRGYSGISWGLQGDEPVAEDYDGDGKTDIAIFRKGVWWIWNSSSNTMRVLAFGVEGDIPVPANFDGDDRADIAVFRPSTGEWYWLRSSGGGYSVVQFGAEGDVPLTADYDGDGKVDLNVFRPSNGTWHRLNSSNQSYVVRQFGAQGDQPIAGDFDGDRRSDLAVWRPSNATWHQLMSSNSSYRAFSFGVPSDEPVVADYDGDGKTDVAVYRPADGVWHMLNTTSGNYSALQFGVSSDIPVPKSKKSNPRNPAPAPSPSPTPTATPAPTATPISTPTPTPIPAPTATPTPTPAPTATPAPTPAPSPTPGQTFTCDYYASPTGSASGTGTSSSPWSLHAALSKTSLVRDGKTLCLRGGTYKGKFISTLNGGGVVRSAPGEWAILDGFVGTTLVGSITSSQTSFTVADASGILVSGGSDEISIDGEVLKFCSKSGNTLSGCMRNASGTFVGGAHSGGAAVLQAGSQLTVTGGNTTYRDFEVTNSYAGPRNIPETTELARGNGITISGGGNSFINLVVHDNSNGVFTSGASSNTLIYGVISYNNGMTQYGEGIGHGYYLENSAGYSRLYESISLNAFNLGMQAFGQTGPYVGGDIMGSVFAGAGSPVGTANLLMVYGTNEVRIDTGKVTESYFYHAPGNGGYLVNMGYGAGINNATFTNNFLGGGGSGFEASDATSMTFTGNKVFGSSINTLSRERSYQWNNNTYYNTSSGDYKFANVTDADNQTFATWKAQTGFDSTSSIQSGNLPDTVIVRPNSYQPGRANIIIYAFSAPASISVNLSSAGLVEGQTYTIKNASNWKGQNVLTGTYRSSNPTVSIPLSGAAASVATPFGWGTTPATSCPRFCALVVVPN